MPASLSNAPGSRFTGKRPAPASFLPRDAVCWLLLAWFLSIPSLTACEGGGEEPHSFTRVREEGVRVVRNQGGPRFAGDLFDYQRIAVLQQRPEQPESLLFDDVRYLHTVEGFFMGGDGRFYVGDRGNARIAVFDSSGRYVDSFGGRGQGPGEFMFMELVDLEDGVLTAIDHNLHRTTRYRTDGTLLETIPEVRAHPRCGEVTIRSGGPSYYDEQGHLWMAAGFTAWGPEGEELGEAATEPIRILYALDTPGQGKGGQSRPPMPYIARPQTRILEDCSVLLSDGVRPMLWQYEPDGSLRRRIETGVTPRRIRETERERFYRDLDERIAEADEDEARYLLLERAAVPFPEYGSLWGRIFTDEYGFIWLEEYQEPFEISDRGGGVSYYLLSPEGEYLGTTRAPGSGRVMRGHLLGEVVDAQNERDEKAAWRLAARPEGFVYPPQR